MKPRLADLITFSAVARHQSFKKASVELGVSPSAISHSIRQLEEQLQLRLVNRTTRSVSLTQVGLKLFENLAPAIKGIDEAVEGIMPFRESPTGSLKITAARQAARLFLSKLCTDFVREYPKISGELFAEDRLLNITQDGMDAGVRLGHVVSENMIAVPVSPSLRFAVVASPDYLQRSGHSAPRKPQDLLKHDCVAFRFPTSERAYSWEFEKNADVIRIDVNSNMAVDDMDVALDAVLNSAGIGYFHEEQIQALVQAGKLVRLLEDWLPERPGFFLYYPSTKNRSFAFKTFLAFLKANVQSK